MKFYLLSSALILGLSCGPKEHGESKPGVYINNVNRTPIELFKEYPECAENVSTSESSFFNLVQFLRGNGFNRQVDMSYSLKGSSLNGYQIEQTFYDTKMMLKKTYRYGRLTSVTFNVTNSPKEMSICPGIKSYDRYSYENASMSATYAIGKTAAKLKEIGFRAPKEVKVFVSPYTIERIENELDDRIVREDFRITDNAYYFPHLTAVIFLPQSEESAGGASFGNIPLWEVPMVGSHEYGHHIFHTIMTSASDSLAVYDHGCFNQDPEMAIETPESIRSVSVSDVLGSFNEGFADLISYYTLDSGESGLRGVICMETNREVSSPRFANGALKMFNQEVMNTFLSEESSGASGCINPNYQQIHTFGAVFAHVSERVMEAMGLTKKEKLATTVAWLKDLNRIHGPLSSQGPERYIVKSYELMARNAMRASRMDKRFQCSIAKQFVPYSRYDQEVLRELGCD